MKTLNIFIAGLILLGSQISSSAPLKKLVVQPPAKALPQQPVKQIVSKAYDLDLSLLLKGSQVIAAPHLIVRAGQTAFISITDDVTREKTFVQVSAKEGATKGYVSVNCIVGKIVNGKSQIISSPSFLARENERASIEESDSKTKQTSLKLSILARKISL